jgi:hypothetical protein
MSTVVTRAVKYGSVAYEAIKAAKEFAQRPSSTDSTLQGRGETVGGADRGLRPDQAHQAHHRPASQD